MVMMQVDDTPEYEFKETEIGLIPTGWELSELSEVLERYQESYNPVQSPAVPYVGLEHIISGNPRLYDYGSSEEVRSSKAYFYPQQILFGKLRPYLDKCVLVNFEGVCSTDILVFNTIRDFAISEFMVFLLHTDRYVKLATDTMTGVNHPRTHWNSLKRFVFPLPPLPEQRRIATVLNAIQNEIAVQDDIIRELREFKRTTMERLFTYGAGDTPAETKMTEFGEVPEHWEVAELEEVADIDYGIQAAVAHLTDETIGIPILTNINIDLDGYLDVSLLRYYPLPEKKSDKILKRGDVLFNWRSGSEKHVGKTTIFDLEDEFTFSSFILRFRVKRFVDNHFLAYFFHYLRNKGFFTSRRGQSSVNSVINASAASKLPVVFPSDLHEQTRVTNILMGIDETISIEEDRKTALQQFFRTMLQQLMTGQIRLLSDDGLLPFSND